MARYLILTAIMMGVSFSLWAENSPNISKIAGHYWYNHQIRFVGDSGNYDVTDDLEIVPYGPQSIYVRESSIFSNGHMCDFSGIAEWKRSAYVYYDTQFGNGCVMRIVPTLSGVYLDDVANTCRNIMCGSRGGFGGRHYTFRHKKPITYMAALLSSTSYKNALESYHLILDAKERGIDPRWANAKKLLREYVFWGNLEGVKQAFLQGADVNGDDHGRGVREAVASGYGMNMNMTKLLLDHGMDINGKEDGKTLLIMVVESSLPFQKYDYIEWLLNNGANPDILYGQGQTALSWAIHSGTEPRIIELLRRVTKVEAKPWPVVRVKKISPTILPQTQKPFIMKEIKGLPDSSGRV